MPKNGGYKVFRDEQAAKKLPLLFLYVKMLEARFGRRFRQCKPTRKVRRMYLAFEKLQVSWK